MCLMKQALKYTNSKLSFFVFALKCSCNTSKLTDKNKLLDMQNQKDCQRMTCDIVSMLRAALPLLPSCLELS